jgi:DHA1 family bicyclomycin/chloramphenicol resistance-like MFS transporter
VDDSAARKLHDSPAAQQATPWGLLILLMAVTAIGPTSLNILVPAVPQLSRDLGADIAILQLTVSLFLIGLGGAQLVMGPLSDRFGRRPVMLGGLALTALSSLAAIAMASAEGLILARIVQAVGASTGIVVGRAIIRDLFDRNRAAAMIGLVATVMVVVPTFGPLIGGVLDTAFGWQSIFIFMFIFSLMVLAWAALTLPETRGFNAPAATQAGFRADLGELAANRRFWGYVLVASLGSATFFAFLGGGPHVVVTLMGRTSAEYGIWFAIGSIGYMAGNFGSSRLSVRHGIEPLILWGIGIEVLGVVIATVLAATAMHWGPAIVFMPQMIVSLGNGLLLPGAIAGAVGIRPQAAGTAAGITGCTQMAIGAAVTQFSGMLLAGASSALPLALLMAVLVAGLVAAFLPLKSRH